jgi:hypothetical protein
MKVRTLPRFWVGLRLESSSYVVGHRLHSVSLPRRCYEEVSLAGSLPRFVGSRTRHQVIPGTATGFVGVVAHACHQPQPSPRVGLTIRHGERAAWHPWPKGQSRNYGETTPGWSGITSVCLLRPELLICR